MKSLTHITEGTDENGNTYKEVRTQDFTESRTKVTNVYYFNNLKVTKYQRFTVSSWINNNFNNCEFKEIRK